MYKYNLSLPGNTHITLNTVCDITQDKNVLLQMNAHLPGLSLSDQPPKPGSCVTTVNHHIGAFDSFLYDKGTIDIVTKESKNFPEDLYHLLYGITRKELLTRHLYPVHAACIGFTLNHTLLVGHSGSGKTSLATAIVNQGRATLFSGNKTVLSFDNKGGLRAIAGTKTITTVDENLQRHADEWPEKKYTPYSDVAITSIHIIKLNDGVQECERLKPLSAAHTLYPYFMDQVNADVIIGGRDIFNGTASQECKENLARNLQKTLTTLPVFKMSGSMQHLKQKLVL